MKVSDCQQDAKKKNARISLRMDDELQARIMAQKRDNESLSAVCNRLLNIGLVSVEGSSMGFPESTTGVELEAMRLSVITLSEQLTQQGEQLSKTLEQLSAALEQNAQLTAALKGEQETAQAALALQGMTQAQKHLEDSNGSKKRSLWARFKATIKGEE